jgi:serine phosphatase RsbU (regulator of sigma subunit)
MYIDLAMQELWSAASYEPHLLSLPFAFAPVAMFVVIAYALVMRGEPVLRAWMLLHFFCLMPYSLTMALNPSVVSPAAMEVMFRVSAAFIPMAAAAGAGFQFHIIGKSAQARWYVWGCVALCVVWIIAGSMTGAIANGIQRLPVGLWYAKAGPYGWLALVMCAVCSLPGYYFLIQTTLRAKSGPFRTQLRFVLAANFVTYFGLSDAGLAYGVGVFPLGWLLLTIGSVLVARALVVEDLLRVRAIDTTAPRLVMHFTLALLLGWVVLGLLGDWAPWWLVTICLAVVFASVRTAIAVIGLINRGTRGEQSTLDRLLNQLVTRARPLESESAVAALAIDVIELGIGTRVDVLVAAADDYGWATATGTKLADDQAPDPLLGAWLAEHRSALFADDLSSVPDDLHDLLRQLFERRGARALVPVASHDELLAIVLLPAVSKRVLGRELVFLERASNGLGEALVHARMAQRAAARAKIAREVELAATVQAQLLPGKGPHIHGDITVVGSWLPAARCAGDFWCLYPLAEDRVLIAIGDVTGHGVASAMVTAAASAAVDVCVRRFGAAVDLVDVITALDAAVRRVGGGQLNMTCFAAILDPNHGEVRFVSCGSTAPYLVRLGDDVELQALVGRGNPLGGSGVIAPKVLQKPLRAGDLVVWYTDGVIEAQDPAGEPFGDRRLQRMLRKLERANMTPGGVHDLIHAGVAAHRAGRQRGDDETLVIAQWRAA